MWSRSVHMDVYSYDISNSYLFPKGFSITQEALSSAVSEHVKSPAVTGWASMGAAITQLRNTPGLRWVNPLEIKNAVESAMTNRFGAKGEAKPKSKVCIAPVPLCDPKRVLPY